MDVRSKGLKTPTKTRVPSARVSIDDIRSYTSSPEVQMASTPRSTTRGRAPSPVASQGLLLSSGPPTTSKKTTVGAKESPASAVATFVPTSGQPKSSCAPRVSTPSPSPPAVASQDVFLSGSPSQGPRMTSTKPTGKLKSAKESPASAGGSSVSASGRTRSLRAPEVRRALPSNSGLSPSPLPSRLVALAQRNAPAVNNAVNVTPPATGLPTPPSSSGVEPRQRLVATRRTPFSSFSLLQPPSPSLSFQPPPSQPPTPTRPSACEFIIIIICNRRRFTNSLTSAAIQACYVWLRFVVACSSGAVP